MLSRDGHPELMMATRRQENRQPGPVISREDWFAQVDLNERLGDIHTGWGWDSRSAGVERVVDPETGNVRDISPFDPPIRFSSLPFSLFTSMNVDWFQTNKEGNYSAGVVLFVINNLPRHLRFLRENMGLMMVIPGPKEPSDFALAEMMEPLIQEMRELQNGVEIPVWNSRTREYENKLVHVDLLNQLTDWIARIKMGGGAGVASEHNFCLYCRSRLSSLVVPAGFQRDGFVYRVPEEELQNRYNWRALETEEERAALFQVTGTRFTALDSLAGWSAADSSPPDGMHLIWLGVVNWIVKQVLVAPNMFHKRPGAIEDPLKRFTDCLARVYFPYNAGRLPVKLGQTARRVKAGQWKLLLPVLPTCLFEAFRDGDDIPDIPIPRGRESSTGAKHQVQRANGIARRKRQYFAAHGRPDLAPTRDECMPSRDPRRHMRQILRAAVAFRTLCVHSISPNEAHFAHELLESMCVEYVKMNVPLSPNFHQLLHLEEFILQYGSLYNTHTWPFERANHDIGCIKTNNHGAGVLEGTISTKTAYVQEIAGDPRTIEPLGDKYPLTESPGDHVYDFQEFSKVIS